jgi:hypothetical protein
VNEALRSSLGAGIIQRDEMTISQLQGTSTDSVQDKSGAIYEPFILGSVNGRISVLFYDFAFKSLYIKGSDPSPTLALQARAGLSFNF